MDDVWFLVSLMVSLLFLFLYYFVRKRICAARQLVIGQTQTANVEVGKYYTVSNKKEKGR